MNKKLLSVLLVLFAGLFLFSLFQIVQIKNEYDSGEEVYENLGDFVSMPSGTPPANVKPSRPVISLPSEDETATTAPTEPPIQWPVIDFEALAEINSDIVAWIYIPDTEINYPVVQGENNDYYLTHMFNKKYNRAGCIFLDANTSSDFTAQNTTLHGHNLRNNTMFAGLIQYQNQEFYDTHPMAMLLTPNGNYQVAFFSGYTANVRASAWKYAFTAEEYILWQAELAEKSCFETDVVPMSSDLILTLSTCSYEFNNARFVLHGILIPE